MALGSNEHLSLIKFNGVPEYVPFRMVLVGKWAGLARGIEGG